MERIGNCRDGIVHGTRFLLPVVRGISFMTISLCAAGAIAAGVSGCTGGQRTEASELPRLRPATVSSTATRSVTPPKETAPVEILRAINPAIPVYAGAEFRADLKRLKRDLDSGGRTYLGQYRGFSPPKAYPPAHQQWRTMQINLGSAMQDPFIPDEGKPLDRNVLLQISESESGPATVIRYVITPRPIDTAQVIVQ